jgi:predicted metal-binding transcription factor (methanogenesis marker protein 9)
MRAVKTRRKNARNYVSTPAIAVKTLEAGCVRTLVNTCKSGEPAYIKSSTLNKNRSNTTYNFKSKNVLAYLMI